MPLVTSHSRRSDAGKPPQISRPNATKGSAKIEVADTCVIGTEAIEGPVVDIADSRANKQQTRRGGPPCPPSQLPRTYEGGHSDPPLPHRAIYRRTHQAVPIHGHSLRYFRLGKNWRSGRCSNGGGSEMVIGGS